MNKQKKLDEKKTIQNNHWKNENEFARIMWSVWLVWEW